MFNSLRLRLFLAFIALVTVALGAVALFASRATTHEFQRYVEHGGQQRRGRFEAMLALYYNRVGSWQDVQPIVDQMGQISGERVVLADGGGVVIADSGHQLEGQAAGRDWLPPVVLVKGGRAVGFLYVSPLSGPAPGAGERVFLGAVSRSLWLAVLAAALSAVLMTSLLSRRILGPVESLTAAVRRMEKGDLSQRVEVESQDEIGELAGAFNAMAGGLARAEELRRNMVSDVAHELRTPLTNIRGNLEALRDGVLEPSPEVVGSLYEEAMLLGRLVDDLQELALAEAGQLGLQIQPVPLAEIVRPAVNGFLPEAHARGIALRAELPPGLPLVKVDPQRMGQVLRNLLKNAVAYSPAGGQVTVGAEATPTELVVRVRDTGVGIAPEHLERVFERFYRVDDSRSRATGGAGLGLTIVRQLVEAHGGRVWAESQAGQGTTFSFSLPLA